MNILVDIFDKIVPQNWKINSIFRGGRRIHPLDLSRPLDLNIITNWDYVDHKDLADVMITVHDNPICGPGEPPVLLTIKRGAQYVRFPKQYVKKEQDGSMIILADFIDMNVQKNNAAICRNSIDAMSVYVEYKGTIHKNIHISGGLFNTDKKGDIKPIKAAYGERHFHVPLVYSNTRKITAGLFGFSIENGVMLHAVMAGRHDFPHSFNNYCAINTFFGTSYGDTISISNSILKACGGQGNDVLRGNNLENDLRGDGGNDTLWGYGGIDFLYGGSGSDTLYGGIGEDNLSGGSGPDIIDGGHDNDYISGDDGHDKIDGGSGNDMIFGNNGDDIIFGSSGNDIIEGGKGHDKIYGGLGDDVLNGNAGHDKIIGGQGSDKIRGQAGNDVIEGGPGMDSITGGLGYDMVVYNPGDNTDSVDNSNKNEKTEIVCIKINDPKGVWFQYAGDDLTIMLRNNAQDDQLLIGDYRKNPLEKVMFLNQNNKVIKTLYYDDINKLEKRMTAHSSKLNWRAYKKEDIFEKITPQIINQIWR